MHGAGSQFATTRQAEQAWVKKIVAFQNPHYIAEADADTANLLRGFRF